MAIERRVEVYEGPGGAFEGMAVIDTGWDGPRPGVMLVPNVLGTKEQDFVTAERLAGLGYAAFVADLYGRGKRAKRGDPEMRRYMDELNQDRELLRERLHASFATLRGMAEVDAAKMAATGYCFGGKGVLDLARSGADVRGVISFHGIYDPPPFANQAITAKILVCHGWLDPLAPPEAVASLAAELGDAGVDWQLHAYGGTGHAFTDETVELNEERSFGFVPEANRRSWAAMTDFLAEIFA